MFGCEFVVQQVVAESQIFGDLGRPLARGPMVLGRSQPTLLEQRQSPGEFASLQELLVVREAIDKRCRRQLMGDLRKIGFVVG